jgi:hypothetical protein
MRNTLAFVLFFALYWQSIPSTTWVQSQGYAGLPSGLIVLMVSGTCPTGFSEVSTLNGQFLQGTIAANGDVGGTGGSDTITPLGTISASFTGTPFSSVINHTHTVSITDPGHNHTQNAHTHTLQAQGGTTAATTGTHTMTSTATGGSSRTETSPEQANSTTATNNANTTGITASTANPAGGVSSITPAGNVSGTFSGTPVNPRPLFVKVIFCQKT